MLMVIKIRRRHSTPLPMLKFQDGHMKNTKFAGLVAQPVLILRIKSWIFPD
jgi:hypothetical protein